MRTTSRNGEAGNGRVTALLVVALYIAVVVTLIYVSIDQDWHIGG